MYRMRILRTHSSLPPPPSYTAISTEQFRNQQRYGKCVRYSVQKCIRSGLFYWSERSDPDQSSRIHIVIVFLPH
jgi:hypothetical protein